jgi:hypothetical protein
MGGTELRANASAHAADLARLGVKLALEDGEPGRVLRWAERWRAGVLGLRPVRPPADEQLAEALAELRQVVHEQREAAAGRATARLVRRQVTLERTVQRLARHSLSAQRYHSGPPSTVEIRRALGERALVEFVESGDQLHAVVLTARRQTLHTLAPIAEIGRSAALLRFWLRRLVYRFGSAAALERAAAQAEAEAARLDQLLLGPLATRLADRPLVAVPTTVLHALPWGLLPSLAGRPVSVAPSAAWWQRAAATASATGSAGASATGSATGAATGSAGASATGSATGAATGSAGASASGSATGAATGSAGASATGSATGAAASGSAAASATGSGSGGAGRVVLVAGPDLAEAGPEIGDLRELYPAATYLSGPDATVAAVTAALDGAHLAHVAAHGLFRSDQPLLSALLLADGPITVYDLERLDRAPRCMVLASCDAGLAEVRPGDELMGLSAALLAQGTVALIAPLLPVPDDATRPAMLALHRAMRAGASPAGALAAACAQATGLDRYTAAGFACIGAG